MNQSYSPMPEHFPFWDRAACLAGLMILLAVADLCRHGRAATRHKEYAFIFLTGLIGCLAGIVTDLITSSISPDYFTVGKDVLGGAGFARRVAMFGLKQGLSAGVIAGAVSLYVSRRKSKSPPLAFGSLLGLLWMPMACGLAGALLLPLTAGRSDPAGLALKLDGAIATAQVPPFLKVWWIHTGLYGGLLAGVIWLAVVATRRRTAGAKFPSGP
jgi:hypothetical protein